MIFKFRRVDFLSWIFLKSDIENIVNEKAVKAKPTEFVSKINNESKNECDMNIAHSIIKKSKKNQGKQTF